MKFGCLTLTVLLVLLCCFVGCNKEPDFEEKISLTEPYGENWELKMTLKNVTPNGATVVFTHSGEGVFLLTGEPYTLERYEEGEWVSVEPLNDLIFHAIGLMIPNNDSYELETSWDWGYGALPDGKYRIGKDVRIEGSRTNEYEGIERIENYIEDVTYYSEFTLPVA